VDALDKPLPVELELMAEKASSLAVASAKLEAALAALAAADQPASSGAVETRGRRSELRAEAARRLWYLIVQREAIGLRSHEDVFRLYRIPPEVRVYSGR
jgi:hypothetical protein